MKPIAVTLAALLLLSSSLPTEPDTYIAGNGFEVTILGTSNVHDWEESVDKATGSGSIIWNADGTFSIQALQLVIAARSIKSTKGSVMDGKTYDALKADEHPNITFKLSGPVNNIRPNTTFTARGDLKVAGAVKAIDLTVKVSGSNSSLVFEGTKTLNMKDFGIAPPTAFMGAMKVGENITVKFKASYNKKITLNQ